MDRIDLHTHSTHSDGSFPPGQLVKLAKEKGLRALALTDHDTVSGVEEALAVGKQLGVEVVPGVEISAQFGPGTMHVLGYYLYTAHPELTGALKKLQQARAARNPKIIDRLETLGLKITTAEVLAISSEQVGRPHIAQVLVQRGYVSSVDEAFSLYLKKGAAAYVEKFRYSPQEAIALIRKAGGLASLAHPFTLGIEEPKELSLMAKDLQSMGLEGIEVFYPDHTEEMTLLADDVAKKLGLLRTGGSDFHGDLKTGSDLGGVAERDCLNYAILQAIKARLQERDQREVEDSASGQ